MILDAQAFVGRWYMHRVIDDRLARQEGQMSGSADFAADGPLGLIYDEVGELRLGRGPAMQAKRRYLWQFDAGQVAVRFEDGRAFHSFIPHGVGRGTDHPCGEDFYTVEYDFSGWPAWSAIWKVRGPRKDYTSQTRYLRR